MDHEHINIDQDTFIASITSSRKSERSDGILISPPQEARLLQRFLSSNFVCRKSTDRIALGDNPAAIAPGGDKANFHAARWVDQNRQCADLVFFEGPSIHVCKQDIGLIASHFRRQFRDMAS